GGGGAWAIVLQQVATSVVYLGLLWVASDWRPRFLFSRSSAGRLVRFSAQLTGANFLSYLQKNIDNLLIGRFLGAAPLGVYSLSYNLMLYPVTRVAEPIYQALFPVLSRIQDDDERVGRIWLRVVRMAAAVVIPAMVGLVIFAPQFVRVVLGAKWDDAVPVIQLLAWSGIVYALNTVTLSVVLSRGLTGQIFRYTLISAVVLVSGLVVGLQFGLEGVALAISTAVAIMWPLYVRIAARTLEMPRVAYWRNLAGVAAATAAMAGAALPLRLLLESWGLPAAAILAIGVPVAAVVYLGACLLVAPGLRGDVGELVSAARRKRRPAPAGPLPGEDPRPEQVPAR
ncbi:MAG: oligosaccharide flippase family protein, partial [Actinomycetota bacterium]